MKHRLALIGKIKFLASTWFDIYHSFTQEMFCRKTLKFFYSSHTKQTYQLLGKRNGKSGYDWEKNQRAEQEKGIKKKDQKYEFAKTKMVQRKSVSMGLKEEVKILSHTLWNKATQSLSNHCGRQLLGQPHPSILGTKYRELQWVGKCSSLLYCQIFSPNILGPEKIFWIHTKPIFF